MNPRSPEFRALMFGSAAILSLTVAGTDIYPASGSSNDNQEQKNTYTQRLSAEDPLAQAQKPATLVTATPRAVPTLARPASPRTVPTLAPRQPLPVRPIVPDVGDSNGGETDQRSAPVPTATVETSRLGDAQTEDEIYGPPYVPERTLTERFAEAFQSGSTIMLLIIYGAAAFGAGYAAKKYLRP